MQFSTLVDGLPYSRHILTLIKAILGTNGRQLPSRPPSRCQKIFTLRSNVRDQVLFSRKRTYYMYVL